MPESSMFRMAVVDTRLPSSSLCHSDRSVWEAASQAFTTTENFASGSTMFRKTILLCSLTSNLNQDACSAGTIIGTVNRCLVFRFILVMVGKWP